MNIQKKTIAWLLFLVGLGIAFINQTLAVIGGLLMLGAWFIVLFDLLKSKKPRTLWWLLFLFLLPFLAIPVYLILPNKPSENP